MEWVVISSYIGVVYNETTGLMYFTLERSHDWGEEPLYYFCYVEDFRRGMRGVIFEVDNSRDDFIDAINFIVAEILDQ